MFAKRTKSAWGNLGMVIVCLPLGWYIGNMVTPKIPEWGLISALAASIVERYEFGPIDDNVLIVVTASIILLFGLNMGSLDLGF
jgi:dolichol kinase